MKNCKRLLSLILAAVLLLGFIPTASLATEPGTEVIEGSSAENTAETVPRTEPAETETPPESTEPETEPPTVPETISEETTSPTETIPEETAPQETVPQETTPEESVPETTIPEETEPDDGTIWIDLSSEGDWAFFAARAVEQWYKSSYNYSQNGTFNFYFMRADGTWGTEWSGGRTGGHGVYFHNADKSRIGYCVQPVTDSYSHGDGSASAPYHTLPWNVNTITADFYGYSGDTAARAKAVQNAISKALIYGSPNNGDKSTEGIIATALLVLDCMCGYRNENLGENFSCYFYRQAGYISGGLSGTTIKQKYDAIVNDARNAQYHNKMPDFAAKTDSTAPIYELVKDSATGNYTLTLEAGSTILNDYDYKPSTPITGLTVAKNGTKLVITATEAAAKAIGEGGITLSAKGKWYDYTPGSERDCMNLWGYGGTEGANSSYQKFAMLVDGAAQPVDTHFKITAKAAQEKFTLKKSINASAACIAQIQGNPMYSLAGAQYQVSVNGTVTETLTTDANGNAQSSKEYDVGTKLDIKEIKAPPGFKLDTRTYTLTITSGENVISVSDEPVFDPPFAITKVDKDTTKPQGDGSFSGAVFKWEYFPNMSWSGTPLRTWHFQTDTYGWAYYRSDYFAPGYTSDELYTDAKGDYKIPLGTVKITEIQNSLGYIVLPEPLYCSIIEDSTAPDGARVQWTEQSLKYIIDMASGNFGVYEPISTELGELTIHKRDSVTGASPQGSGSLAGAEFEIINRSANAVKVGGNPVAEPGQVCYTLVTDANGDFSTGKILPYGTYELRESKAPEGYALNTDWSVTFQVREGALRFEYTCENDVLKGGLEIIKQSAVELGSTGADARLEGIHFSIISQNANPVEVGGVTYAQGQTVKTLEIAWDGSRWYTSTGPEDLPYGSYTLRENPTDGNGSLANGFYLLAQPIDVTIGAGQTLASVTVADQARPGSITVHKVDPLGEPLADAEFLLEWSKDGQTWTPVTASDTLISGGCSSPGLKDGQLITGADGTVTFSGLDTRVQYRLTETKAPEGYQLLTEPVIVGLLPVDDVSSVEVQIDLRVVNSPVFRLPATGDSGFRFLSVLAGVTLAGTVALAGTAVRRKRR